MKTSISTLLTIGFLIFFCVGAPAQAFDNFNLPLDDESALTPHEKYATVDSSLDFTNISTVSEVTLVDQETILGAGPPSMNMLGGFMQFLFLVAVAVAVLFAWLLYRKHRAEQLAALNDNWG